MSDAVWQDGEESVLFDLLSEAEVRVAPVGQTQVDGKLSGHPRQRRSEVLLHVWNTENIETEHSKQTVGSSVVMWKLNLLSNFSSFKHERMNAWTHGSCSKQLWAAVWNRADREAWMRSEPPYVMLSGWSRFAGCSVETTKPDETLTSVLNHRPSGQLAAQQFELVQWKHEHRWFWWVSFIFCRVWTKCIFYYWLCEWSLVALARAIWRLFLVKQEGS